MKRCDMPPRHARADGWGCALGLVLYHGRVYRVLADGRVRERMRWDAPVGQFIPSNGYGPSFTLDVVAMVADVAVKSCQSRIQSKTVAYFVRVDRVIPGPWAAAAVKTAKHYRPSPWRVPTLRSRVNGPVRRVRRVG
jgi:hypothetical protein